MGQVDKLPDEPAKYVREWLRYDERPVKDYRPKIRLTSRATHAVTFDGLTEKEVQALEAALITGSSYVRVVDGRLHAWDAWEGLPAPQDDPICAQHWKPAGEIKVHQEPLPGEGWHSPSISITGLGAGLVGWNDAEEYKRKRYLQEVADNQKKVEDCGFVCLRSRREPNGKYWEDWVLHFLSKADGPLKQHMDKLRSENRFTVDQWREEVEEACRFLAMDLRVHFGSMDITIQRWALCCPD